MRPVIGLILSGGIPPWIDVDYGVRSGKVESGTAGLERDEEDEKEEKLEKEKIKGMLQRAREGDEEARAKLEEEEKAM